MAVESPPIIINIDVKGERKTKKAIKNLSNEEKKLAKAVRGANKAFKSNNSHLNLNVRNHRNLHRATNATAGAFSVLRSKLLLATFGLSLLSKSIGKVLKDFGDFEASQKRIDNVLRSTGGAVGFTSSQIQEMTLEMENLTGVAQTTLNDVGALLLTFTQITGEGFEPALSAVVDMTAGMNAGRITQEGLKSSAIQLGKALNDPILGLTALSRVGVRFSGVQRRLLRAFQNTGKIAKAQAIIMDEVNEEFGKQGEIDGYTKSILKLQTAMGNLSKDIGEDLTPEIQELVEGLTEFIKSLEAQKIVDLAQALAIATTTALALRKALVIVAFANTKFLKVLKRAITLIPLMVANMSRARVATLFLARTIKILTSTTGMGLLITALTSLAFLFTRNKDEMSDYESVAKRTTKTVKELSKGLGILNLKGLKERLKDTKDALKDSENAMVSNKARLDIIRTAINLADEGVGKYNTQMQELLKSLNLADKHYFKNSVSAEKLRDALVTLSQETIASLATNQKNSKSLNATIKEIEALIKSLTDEENGVGFVSDEVDKLTQKYQSMTLATQLQLTVQEGFTDELFRNSDGSIFVNGALGDRSAQ